jgi:hypothetical protein
MVGVTVHSVSVTTQPAADTLFDGRPHDFTMRIGWATLLTPA